MEPTGDPRRTSLINRELRRLSPDLVSFQEVSASGERNQLAELLDGLDLQPTHQADVVAAAPSGVEPTGGNALATRWPHRIVEGLDLRMADAMDAPWDALAALVSIPGEGDLLFIAASSAWRLDAEAVRERQVVAMTDLDARHVNVQPTAQLDCLFDSRTTASARRC